MERVVDATTVEPVDASDVDERDHVNDEAARHLGHALGSGFAPPNPPDRDLTSLGMVQTLQHVQRLAGNAAAVALVERGHRVQRDPEDDEEDELQLADVPVESVSLSASIVTIPAADTVQATAAPADATGVTWSLREADVTPTDVTIDASTGEITIGDSQQGGSIQVRADASDGSAGWTNLNLIERPVAITSTSTAGARTYGGEFTHTFSAPSGQVSGLREARINERFAAGTAEMPWGGTFTVAANAAGSAGWALDSAGTMTGPDEVDIPGTSIDIGRVLPSASNPDGPGLPQGFTLTQQLFAFVQPGGTLESTPFTTVSHTRRLVEGPSFEVSAGQGTITEDYVGPNAVTGARASSTTVMASPPRPETGEWNRRKVTVEADPVPDTASLSYAIRGADLGCSVDDDGEVTIGSRAGTITVRVSATRRNYDEVSITITEHSAPSEESADDSGPTTADGSTTPPGPGPSPPPG